METPFRLNASMALSSPPNLPIATTTSDVPMTLGENRLDPPSPSLPYSQAPGTIRSFAEPFPSSDPFEYQPTKKPEIFSGTCHRALANPNRKRGPPTSSFDPAIPAKTLRMTIEPLSAPDNYEELILGARNFLIRAASVAPSKDQQTRTLDLLEVFREYTEKGQIASISKMIGSQVSNLETAARKIEKITRQPPKTNIPPLNTQTVAQPQSSAPSKPLSFAQTASQGPLSTTTAPQEWKLVQNKANKPPRTPKICKRLILIQSSIGSPSQFSSFALRNAFNKAFLEKGVKGPVVNTVSRTQNQNIVVTTTPSFSADYLLEKKEIWQSILPFKSAQKDESWHKVAIHGIPTRDFNTPNGMQLIVDEITTFNQGFKPIGTPYWLTTEAKRKNQLAGSVVVAFATEEEANRAIRYRLYIGGASVRVEKLYSVAPTTQCGKCQGYGHLDNHCKKGLKCRLCAENHATAQHKCSICPTKGAKCLHLAPKCSNCKGAHSADSETCEILLAIKSKAL
jgi:hypothetical protein